VVLVNPRGLKEVWGKWPGDETIEEVLAGVNGSWGLTETSRTPTKKVVL
jgi:hypothetical protein